jgi:hypothetical protein
MTPAQLAAMPVSTPQQWQEQDLAAAHAVELIALACEGNGDAYDVLMTAVAELRACVRDTRERDAIAEADDIERRRSPRLPKLPKQWPFPVGAERALV